MTISPRKPLSTPDEWEALCKKRLHAIGRMPFGTFLVDHKIGRLPNARRRGYSPPPGAPLSRK
jgi:hypothetical protein